MSTAVVILVAGMLVTGCLNTLLLKYQDQTCEQISDLSLNGCASFPVLQSLMMFVGETMCFLVIGVVKLHAYLQSGDRNNSPLTTRSTGEYAAVATEEDDSHDTDTILRTTLTKDPEKPKLQGKHTMYLALPALCDICGTTTMSVGLLFVDASVFQMCRGVLVLFVGLFSVVFLRRRLMLYQWMSLLLVTLGVFVVGLSNVTYNRHFDPNSSQALEASHALLGIGLIVGAQLFTASQFSIEEFILSRYSVEPLKVAGLEGAFGTLLSTAGILLMYLVYGSTNAGSNGTFDALAGFKTALGHASIWPSFLLFAFSIASFNFFGLSVTRTVSATSRSTIDTCRTIFIWGISLLLGWEHFKVLQLIGFVILVYATLCFNGVIKPPPFLRSSAADADADHIEVESGREHTME